jgi:TatD DNase family protein
VIDSHTHLHSCREPAEQLVAAALAVGINRIVTVGTDSRTNREALAAAARFEQVYAAVGVHPSEATGFDDSALEQLRAVATQPRCVAIGETGLDYYRDHAPRDDQMRAFRAQVALAHELGKPLVIHTREADDDTLAVLRELAGDLTVVLHCFSMAERLAECLEHERWYISFAGNVTYPKATALMDAALRVPAERLLVETDAPYLSPIPYRGKPNQPANVIETAKAIAIARRAPYAELEASIEAAGAAVFGW